MNVPLTWPAERPLIFGIVFSLSDVKNTGYRVFGGLYPVGCRQDNVK